MYDACIACNIRMYACTRVCTYVCDIYAYTYILLTGWYTCVYVCVPTLLFFLLEGLVGIGLLVGDELLQILDFVLFGDLQVPLTQVDWRAKLHTCRAVPTEKETEGGAERPGGIGDGGRGEGWGARGGSWRKKNTSNSICNKNEQQKLDNVPPYTIILWRLAMALMNNRLCNIECQTTSS